MNKFMPLLYSLMLFIILVSTLYLWHIFSLANQEHTQTKFNHLVTESNRALQDNIAAYEDIVLATEGLLNTGANLSPKAWKYYTKSQNRHLKIKVYEGKYPLNDHLIYEHGKEYEQRQSTYRATSIINFMHKEWLIVWESTQFFEKNEEHYLSSIILSCGLLFSLFLAFLLLTKTIKKPNQEWLANKKAYLGPTVIFLILSSGAFKLYFILEDNQTYYVQELIESELNKIDSLISAHIKNSMTALQRMAHRWELAERTQYSRWKIDALDYVDALSGLSALEWIDSSYHIRWAEPLKKNSQVIGLHIIKDEQTRMALQNAMMKHHSFVSVPFHLKQGYDAFIAYFPLKIKEKFDGFIAGVFSINEFFKEAIDKQTLDNFQLNLKLNNTVYYELKSKEKPDTKWLAQKKITIGHQEWTLEIIPKKHFLAEQRSILPFMILVASLIIALLSALVFRFVLVSHLKSLYLKESHEQLKESEERYNLVVDGMSVGVWDWKLSEKGFYWSDTLKKMFGIAPNTTTDMDFFLNHLHPDDKKNVLTLLDEHVNKKKPYDIEYRFMNKEGTYSWFHACGQAKWDEEGKAIRMAGSVIDINDRVLVSIALQKSNNLNKAILTGAKHLIIATDTQGVVTVFNKAAERALGYFASEIVGKYTPEIWHDPEEVQHRANELSGELGYHVEPGFNVFVEKAILSGSDENDWTFIRKNGSRFPVRLTATSIKIDDAITGYLGIIEDITERKQIENIKNEFVSMISHELRTPITSIRASLGFILDVMTEELPKDALQFLTIANDNCERLILLINDMLDMNKIASGEMRFNIKEERIAPLLKKAKELNQGYADKYSVSITLKPVNEDLTILVDSDRFLQIITNLLSNAIKFSKAQSTVVLKVSQKNPKSVRIIVADKGVGMSDEFQQRIFTPFSQDNSEHKNTKEGTGLGLHICKQMVEKMNGHIGFKSVMNKGTSFWIEFDVVS